MLKYLLFVIYKRRKLYTKLILTLSPFLMFFADNFYKVYMPHNIKNIHNIHQII